MQAINLRSFRQKVRYNARAFKSFLTRLEKNPPKDLHKLMEDIDKKIWKD